MIITIARQCGSGGHEIGKELTSRLGLELYDRKKLEEEAKKLGKLDENKEFFQEKAVNSLLYSIAVSYGASNPMERSFELIRELTQQKSAVIIGRCSGAIYANDPDATTIFLHADKDCRIKRVMKRDGIDEKKAAKLIKEVDEKRASFHKFCTGKEWGDAGQYQLSIDTGKLDISDAADMIINYINAKNRLSF
ncbi:MAG: cytidylate kinase-like family protein [Blautia sp.]|uniref:cytidylate kinase-like family protein n=1 Tax=unclassified Blautia TaxID=2648079 RepID=UPI0025BDB4AB|nr:cytidylate kinase-like family protein [Blautia sp.]MCI6302892.1 cytidylate kinase-like family protein [Blautia sp.]MCI7448777.1 cytidylate kinase-like family protein [Blautia sp.]MDD6414817.1 cytidylate kinase-like family protein [Blautia sp.]MDY4114551.1 cytidylate kinase-like family protein [Blautia sp.]